MEDDQATKQPSDHCDQQQRVPFTRRRQLDSDFVLAVALQDQERAFSSLETIESETESEQNEDDEDYNQEDYEFFESGGLGAEFGFLEEEYGDDEDEDVEMDDDEDDEVDVDELTYEELIALGEFIGVEERGLSEKEISSCLRPTVCEATSSFRESGVVDRCVICQVEYEDGENLVALRCEHSYHSECITKWLQIKKCCPICSSEVSSSSNDIKNNDDNVSF